MTDVAEPSETVARWQRRMLPADLLERPTGGRSARDWIVDVVVFLFALGIGAAGLADIRDDHGDFALVADAVVGTLACLALWFRRRHPAAIAVAAVGLSSVSAMAGGAGLIAIFNAAVRSSRRVLLLLAAMTLAGSLVFGLLYPSAGGVGTQVALGALVYAVAVGWGLFTRVRRELVLSLRDRASRLEAEQRLRVEQAREAERRRIAREMHDVLAHRLSLLSVHAGALEFRPDAPPEEVATAAGVIRTTAQAALDELRAVIGVLRDDGDPQTVAPPQPTLAQLPALLEESRAAGVHIESRLDLPDEELSGAVGRTAYRIVQEGLTNARKHAPGAAVVVTVSPTADGLVVEVLSRPPVAAPQASPGGGAGLAGLAERVSLAGGELEHGVNAGGDFVLRALLPRTT